jgi:Family of unknown function (DUF5989)
LRKIFASSFSWRALPSFICSYLAYFQLLEAKQWAPNCNIEKNTVKYGEAVMRFIRTAGHRFGIVAELFSFFWGHKRWWMLPMLVTLFLFGALLILAQSSAIAPFIYTLF